MEAVSKMAKKDTARPFETGSFGALLPSSPLRAGRESGFGGACPVGVAPWRKWPRRLPAPPRLGEIPFTLARQH